VVTNRSAQTKLMRSNTTSRSKLVHTCATWSNIQKPWILPSEFVFRTIITINSDYFRTQHKMVCTVETQCFRSPRSRCLLPHSTFYNSLPIVTNLSTTILQTLWWNSVCQYNFWICPDPSYIYNKLQLRQWIQKNKSNEKIHTPLMRYNI